MPSTRTRTRTDVFTDPQISVLLHRIDSQKPVGRVLLRLWRAGVSELLLKNWGVGSAMSS